jgi:hypothetical protein
LSDVVLLANLVATDDVTLHVVALYDRLVLDLGQPRLALALRHATHGVGRARIGSAALKSTSKAIARA